MQATGARPKITVTADGKGVVGHAAARLLADLADTTGLSGQFSRALAGLRQRDSGHDPGRVAADLAVMIADGGAAIADLAVLRGQRELFGAVASDATAWRVLDGTDMEALVRLRVARAAAREVAWAQRYETRGGLPVSVAAHRPVAGLVLDIDASIVVAHSEKEQADRTWKKTFGFHPLFAFWTTPTRRWPASCAPAAPGRTPPPTTSRCSTKHWRRSRMHTATAPRS